MADDADQRAIMAAAREGDTLHLSDYLNAVEVDQRDVTPGGVYLTVSSPRGSTPYRLRATDDDDDRLVLEKSDGDDDGWRPFIRLTATPTENGVA